MTDKEKAKAYDEALEAAQKELKQDLHESGVYAIKRIFPQLAESENERIRKELIKALKTSKTVGELKFTLPEPTREECIAYLEKQKEQKPESCDCSRDEESYTNGIHHVLMNPEAYGLIKQQPAEQLGGTFTSYDMAKTFTDGQNYVIAHPEKFGLCKPAEWSDEDEIKIISIISFLKSPSLCAMDGNKGIIDANIKYLKSIKDKVQSKSHWKPSEEQMWALDVALENFYHQNDRAALESLYNDLKKL